MVQAVHERAKRDQLPVQPHGHAPDAADQLPVGIQLVGQDPLLGAIELTGKTVGNMVE
jgi:hypothetical protein